MHDELLQLSGKLYPDNPFSITPQEGGWRWDVLPNGPGNGPFNSADLAATDALGYLRRQESSGAWVAAIPAVRELFTLCSEHTDCGFVIERKRLGWFWNFLPITWGFDEPQGPYTSELDALLAAHKHLTKLLKRIANERNS